MLTEEALEIAIESLDFRIKQTGDVWRRTEMIQAKTTLEMLLARLKAQAALEARQLKFPGILARY